MLWGGRWKTWCVFMPLGRGVLHTPYRRPIYGANDPNDRSPMRILVPCGAIWWGVCNTPLPRYPKNDHGRGMFCRVIPKTGCLGGMLWGGGWKMWCVFMPLGRGVLNTPHKRPSEGGRVSCLWLWTGIRHLWDGVLWGVCDTPLP